MSNLKKFFLSFVFLFFSVFAAAHAQSVVVEQGDTLSKISDQLNSSVAELADYNDIKNANLIYPEDVIKSPESSKPKQGRLGAGGAQNGEPLPVDNYDTFITAPVAVGDTEIFVNEIPNGIEETVYTIFGSDGRTVEEKVYCTSATTTPVPKITNCTRGVTTTPGADKIVNETGSTGSTHSKNSRIAITNNINFTGKGLSMLYGFQTSSLKNTDRNKFFIGDGSNTTNTQIYAKNGDSNTPFIEYDNSNDTWLYSEDGLNTKKFASSSPLNASSTAGIGIQNSEIYVKASSTEGLSFDGDGEVYVKDGSGISFDGNGNLIVDNVATTSGSGKIVKTSSTGRIDNSFIDKKFEQVTEIDTATAGESISSTYPVFMDQDDANNEFKITSSTVTTSIKFNGFALTEATDGNDFILQTEGVVNQFSGLDVGQNYYVNEDGTSNFKVSSTPGNHQILVGKAVSSTAIQIEKGSISMSGSVGGPRGTTSDLTITTGFRPNKIKIVADKDRGGSNKSAKSIGTWTPNHQSSVVYRHSLDESDSNADFVTDVKNTSKIFYSIDPSNDYTDSCGYKGEITNVDHKSFTIGNITQVGGCGDSYHIQWTATGEGI